MVQARRAKVRPARVIIPLAVAAALLVGGSFAIWKFWPNTTTAGPQAESSTAAAESQAPTTAVSSPSPSETPSPTASPASAESQKALEACQAKVKAADEVLREGKIGVSHWAIHVKAQADNLDGKITLTTMKTRFKATRLKGPADLKRYDDALSKYEDLKGSCAKVKGADSTVAATLKKCDERKAAQKPVLEATAAGMKDWQAHQKLMQLNAVHKAGTPAEAEASWLRQFHAAPKHIKAFKKATADFKDATPC